MPAVPRRTQLVPSLDAFWSARDGYYRSRTGVVGGVPEKALDVSVILGVLHAGRKEGTHSVLDPKAQATLTALEELFDAEYAINRRRPSELGPAMGRYANDAYYGGNPWYLATLAAAEFYFKLATALQSGAEMPTTSENERFRRRLSPRRSAREFGLRGGRSRTRRHVHANRAGVHSSQRRSFGAIRSDDRRPDLGQTPGLELCRLHHRRREPPPGRPGHSRLRSLRDFRRPGVTIRLPNWRRKPEGVANEHVGVEAGAARINAPAAIDGDRVGFDARPFVACLIAVLEGCVAAAEIGVALPQRGVRKLDPSPQSGWRPIAPPKERRIRRCRSSPRHSAGANAYT